MKNCKGQHTYIASVCLKTTASVLLTRVYGIEQEELRALTTGFVINGLALTREAARRSIAGTADIRYILEERE